jgi:hypothetical protein
MLQELSLTKKRINNATTIAADLLIKQTFDLFIGKKVGDVIVQKVYLKMTTN